MIARTARAVAAAALVLLSPPSLGAQQRAAPFESITLGLSVVRNVGRNSFHEQWSPRTGIGVRAGMPFYAGVAEAGVEQLAFRSRTASVPGFTGRYYFVGWGVELAPASRLVVSPAFRFGNYAMRFDDPALSEGRRHESEIALELLSRASWRAGVRWSASVSANYRVVLTEPRIRHLHLTAGFARTFKSPAWLREFLD
jgi:hypothetical protein